MIVRTTGRRSVLTGVLVAGAMLAGAGMFAMAQDTDLEELLVVARSHVTAVEVIRWGEDANGLAKFDTRTGDVWRFNGDIFKPNVKAEWIHEVDGVGDRPIGTYRLQHANTSGLFLVDAVTGATWILRERAQDRFEWEAVKNFSSMLTSGNGNRNASY